MKGSCEEEQKRERNWEAQNEKKQKSKMETRKVVEEKDRRKI